MTTYDLKMKKTIPSKEVLEQYIYDYGIDKTAQIFHISTEELDKKINWKPQYEQYSYNPANSQNHFHHNISKLWLS